MRNLPSGWNTVMAKFGLARTKRGRRGQQNCVGRPLRFESLEDRRVLAPVTVNTLTDVQDSTNLTSITALISNPGPDGKISLREAIVAANADTAQDTVNFSVTGTINLSTLGELAINTSLTINGPGVTVRAFDPTPTEINGDGNRIFNVTDTTTGSAPPQVQMIGLTLTGADIGGFFPSQGGAIRSEGLLTLLECTIVENHAETGGGVFVEVAGGGPTSRAVLTIEDSLIDNNEAFTGGGIAIVSGDEDNVTEMSAPHLTMHGAGFGQWPLL